MGIKSYPPVISITDHYGVQNYLAPNGEIVALPLFKLVGDAFALSALDTGMWSPALVGSGTATVTGGELVIATGITANSSAILESIEVARFIGLGPNKLRALVQLPDTGTANNLRQWGIDTPTRTDGAHFRMNGTAFSVLTKKTSVETIIANGSFNGQYGPSFTPGTISHVYEIIYQPRQVVFIVDNKILHTVNANAAPWTDTLHMHIHFENVNSGGSTANVFLHARLGVIARFGISEAQKTGIFQSGTTAGVVLKVGPGDLHGMILSAIQNNSSITLYDNTSAAGTILFATGAMPPNANPLPLDFAGISFNIGLTLVIATANSNALVLFD